MFFDLLRANGLLVRMRRSRKPRTTFSGHLFRTYPDLVKGLTVNCPDEVWVSDITYIHLSKGFAYLSLVTDMYSRRIAGYHLSMSLSADGCLSALTMALKGRKSEAPLIHHSDRGIQYCSSAYTNLLKQSRVSISMTQSGDPRDNAIAERVNGILKQELLEEMYINYKQAQQAVSHAIAVYNHHRPHSSVNMMTPEQAYNHKGEISRRWKSYYKTAMV